MAVTFTSNTTYLYTASVPASVNQNSASVTLSLWVYCTATGGGSGDFGSDPAVGMYIGLVGNISGSNYADFTGLINYTGFSNCDLNRCSDSYSTGDTDVTGTSSLNTWQHLAATFDSSNTKVYVNGVQSGTGTGTIGTSKPWVRLVIGGFAGDAQDAVCFNRVLTADEIQQLYRRRHISISRANIVGHWPLCAGGSATKDWSGVGGALTAVGTVNDATRTAPASWAKPISPQALRYR